METVTKPQKHEKQNLNKVSTEKLRQPGLIKLSEHLEPEKDF